MVSIKVGVEMILLLCMSIQDFRTKEIPVLWPILYTGIGVCFCWYLYNGMHLILSIVCGMWIGCVGFIAKKLSKGGVGIADIWIMAVLPLWQTGMILWKVCILAVILSGMNSMMAVLWKQSQKTIAFIPWLGVSCLVMTVI